MINSHKSLGCIFSFVILQYLSSTWMVVLKFDQIIDLAPNNHQKLIRSLAFQIFFCKCFGFNKLSNQTIFKQLIKLFFSLNFQAFRLRNLSEVKNFSILNKPRFILSIMQVILFSCNFFHVLRPFYWWFFF